MRKAFTKKHVWVFIGMLAVFMVLNYGVVYTLIGSDSGHTRQLMTATLVTFSGPMTGGIVRDFQSCCVRFSLWVLLLFSGPALLIGIIMQIVPLGFQKGAGAVRMTFWVLGWLLWFLGGFISYGHALS